ncbi:hypothetical protein [Lapillicoccus jejuensis]|uniref:Uncharacterized protein n=1 Tax=Lapillicoccus jejuensis TaxID=402171 RepID=A0A542DW23_9MICO|nr:hypothetical protein [Lapillicoccus jejuensis]TQJ07300.1 hypothetical protein FB458_0359 [Lapillicoccus jejuensis]
MTRRWRITALVVLLALTLLGYWLLVLVYGTHAVTASGGDGEALRGLFAPAQD